MKDFIFKDCRSLGAGISKWIALILIIVFVSGCSCLPGKGTNKPGSKTGIANPASVNCINKGGTLSIQKREAGGEYGICIFEDNRQCEEWALFRGECPVGGRKITGYVTPAAQYCAITGGSYIVTGQQGNKDKDKDKDKEQGTCTFSNGKSCDVWDYYSGKCSQ